MLKQLVSLVTRSNTDHLAQQYREMHAHHAFPGKSWQGHVETLRKCIPNLDELRIVDFGCGILGGLAQHIPHNVTPYDPYIEEFSKPPWDNPFDVLFSSDVLEHLPLREIQQFLITVRKCSPKFVFLNVSTRAAHKRLPDGSNAHATVKPGKWWLQTVSDGLSTEYCPMFGIDDLIRFQVTLCFIHQKQLTDNEQK